MDMDMMSADPPGVRIWPVRGQPGLSPALMWDDLVPGLATRRAGFWRARGAGCARTCTWPGSTTPRPRRLLPVLRCGHRRDGRDGDLPGCRGGPAAR